MKVTCQACSAQYTIADDKVKGRKVKIRCKACQTPIVVDGQNPPAESVGSGQSEAPPSLDPFAPETAMSGDADVWNVNLSDTDSRTMTTAEVIEGFRSGLVTTDAFVWKDGMTDWLPIMDCVELAPLLQGPTDPPAPVAGQTPLAPAAAVAAAAAPKLGGMPMLSGGAQPTAGGARAASAKQQSGADLFGDLATAGSEGEDVDVSTSAPRGLPVMPGSTAYDDKPTGARNENSVLFSLDAMKAGFVGGPSAASDRPKPNAPKAAPRATQPSNPDDPFGMGGAAGLGGMGTGFSLNANQALLTAPAPPEPKPVAVPAFSPVGAPVAVGMDAKTKKLVTLGGIGAGAIILVLLGALVFGGKSKSEEESEAAAASASALAAAKKEEPKAEEKKEEPKAEEKKEEPAPTASASAEEKKEEPKAEAAKADASKTGSHSTSPAGTKKEEPATPGPSTAAPFSKASAISALGSAASSAGGCKKPGGPTGVGKVQVTFAPSGRVTSATVMGSPFAGTAVGGCVAGRFRAAKVPAFAGSPVTVSKSFSIN
ncbi:MAG: hypothetical protein K0R38_7503 [Polyangiaceae bacterium]|jgi:predicted Zn finger-like uncharacterized protein|nr:hypothetical protein [Polyangiaceae bacterium]